MMESVGGTVIVIHLERTSWNRSKFFFLNFTTQRGIHMTNLTSSYIITIQKCLNCPFILSDVK